MKVVCAHCALPFSVARVAPGRAVYCCSGCALAARMTARATPHAAGGPTVSPALLVTALGAAFVWFNQLLFWLLAGLLAQSADGAVYAGRLAWGSLGAGVILALVLGVLQVTAGARRGIDWLVWTGSAVVIGCALANRSPAAALLANAALAAWALRGLVRARAGSASTQGA